MDNAKWWTDSHGFIELWLLDDDIERGHHSGPCDSDIAALRRVPYIAKQLDRLDPATVARSLRECGAWDDAELSNHDENLSRLLWIACGDIQDGMFAVTYDAGESAHA